MRNLITLFLLAITLIFNSCTKSINFHVDFNNTNSRIWIGKGFWSIHIEERKVCDGHLERKGEVPDSRVNISTHVFSVKDGKSNFWFGELSHLGSEMMDGKEGYMLACK